MVVRSHVQTKWESIWCTTNFSWLSLKNRQKDDVDVSDEVSGNERVRKHCKLTKEVRKHCKLTIELASSYATMNELASSCADTM